MLNRRTVIAFEKLERSFYHLPDAEPVIEHCPVCGVEVSWLTPGQAAALKGITVREVFRRIEADSVHFNETATGMMHICPNSLGLK